MTFGTRQEAAKGSTHSACTETVLFLLGSGRSGGGTTTRYNYEFDTKHSSVQYVKGKKYVYIPVLINLIGARCEKWFVPVLLNYQDEALMHAKQS